MAQRASASPGAFFVASTAPLNAHRLQLPRRSTQPAVGISCVGVGFGRRPFLSPNVATASVVLLYLSPGRTGFFAQKPPQEQAAHASRQI